MKVREHGRIVNVACLVAVGANADGHREVLGLDVCASQDGAGWLAFLRGLTARGLKGVKLVISDAHRGLLDAIGAALRRGRLTSVRAGTTTRRTCGQLSNAGQGV